VRSSRAENLVFFIIVLVFAAFVVWAALTIHLPHPKPPAHPRVKQF
jgi:hypothetical protein